MRIGIPSLVLRLLGVMAFGVLGAAQGCSPLTNTTAVQCTSEAECLSLGPDFAGTTCDPITRSCVRVAADQDLCTSNSQCVDKAGGAFAICRKSDRKCVTLQTPECPTVMGKKEHILNDNTVVLGALTPAGHTELGDNMEAAMGLAQLELTTQVRGLPAGGGSTDVRPLVIVACREFGPGGFDVLIRAAKHLVNDIQVPAVIGPVDPANQNYVLNEVLIPGKVLSIQPFGFTSAFTGLPNPFSPKPIIWSNSLTDAGSTDTVKQLVLTELEKKVRADGVTGPIRIALMAEDNFFGQSAAKLMEGKLVFNGKSAADNLADGNYLRVNIGNLIDPIGNPAPEAKVAAAISAVIDFKPHIILHSYAPAAISPTFFNLVLSWPSTLPMPYHVDMLTTFAAFAPMIDVLNAVPPLRSHLFSVQTHVPPESAARVPPWILAFRTAYPQFRTSNTAYAGIVQVWYDAAYLAAYAIVANGSKPVTGENLAGTLPQLVPPATTVRTGTEDLTKGFSLLTSGQGIDLSGISGNMDLDPRTGFVNYDVEITCPQTDPATGRVTGFHGSGFWTEKGVPKGALSCGP